MLQIRSGFAFLVILMVFLKFSSTEDITAVNDAPQAVSVNTDFIEDLECMKADQILKDEVKEPSLDDEAMAPLPETDLTDLENKGNDVLSNVMDARKEAEFDEHEEHILDTQRPFDDDDDNLSSTVYEKAVTTPDEILKAMRSLEKFGSKAEENDKINQVVTPRMQEIFRSINTYVKRIIDLTAHPEHANKFLDKDGFRKCIVPNMWITYPEMRKNLLILIKKMLEVSPKTPKVIPIEILDQILRIFENDDNLAHKSLVIDILYIWLPGNPMAQGRVIQLTGLYPFYKHLKSLDTNVVYNMIDLFNTLIKEHVDFRKNKEFYPVEERGLYQKIGLIEQISTRKNCYGLLTVFQDALEFNTRRNNLLIPALELVNLVKPTCLKKYKGRKKPLELFTRLQTYVSENDNRKYLKSYLTNFDIIEAALKDYVEELQPKHVEL